MKKRIENPKVFISYAWGSEKYQNKVLAFVSQLRSNGIDTVFDKFDLTEGNDIYAFMEKSVNDPLVTNVLILLDPIYAQKADNRFGGVGAETLIISAIMYQDVIQDKFIPVVMERDKNGSVCVPTYLRGKLYFDLSLEKDYDNSYQRLVKKLYGEEVYTKPELGSKPSWVNKSSSVYRTIDKPLDRSLIPLNNVQKKNKQLEYAQLIFKNDGEYMTSVKIPYKTVRIGRGVMNDIVIKNATVSPEQCQIVKKKDKYILENYSKRNTTRLNGEVVKKSKEIKYGDVVGFGNITFIFDNVMETG